MKEAIAAYLEAERAIEDRLLMRLRPDLADLPVDVALPGRPGAPPAEAAVPVPAATESLRAELKLELAALAAGEVLAAAALRAGVSAGLVGAGEVGAAATLGLGLAAGPAAERAIAWAWGDPRDELGRRLESQVGELQRRLLDGTAATPGLRAALGRAAGERARLRREVVLRAIGEAAP